MANDKVLSCLGLAGLTAVLTLPIAPAIAQVPEAAEARLRATCERGEWNPRSFRARWLPDGSGYTRLESLPGGGGQALVQYDAESGTRLVLVSSSQLVPSDTAETARIEGYELVSAGTRLLLQATRRGNGGAATDYWLMDRAAKTLRRVTTRAGGGRFVTAPDGKRIVFADRNNLYLHDVDRDRTVALTADGVPGMVDYRCFGWSPGGDRLAIGRWDSTDVRLRSTLVPGDPSYPGVREVRFARVGGTIPTLRVGIVEAEGGAILWLELPAPEEGFYLGPVEWAQGGNELFVEWRSRGRDRRQFLIADVRTGELTCIYEESDPAWVVASYDLNKGLEWIRDGRAFVLVSEKDGWRHASVVSRDGEDEVLLTPGAFDILERGVVDEPGGRFYFFASPDDATQRYLYRVALDGRSEPERVTPADRSGWHTYDFAPGAKWAFHTYSTFDSPPVTELVELPAHRVLRVLEDNEEVRRRVAAQIARPTEFFQLDIGNGVELDAWMIEPRDFDPSRRYPVLVYQYSEPHAQVVLDMWDNRHVHFHRVIADLGYLVVCMDTRGTPAPKGAAWRRAVFPSLGPLSTEEQAAGLQELARTRSYVDLSRVGVWGWSGGGSNTLNAMFRKPDVYHVGIAVAPKPQPHLYNAWFQEIYMRTREQNPEGYRRSAPINFAEGLAGKLLIIHGTGETNTHLQITEGLVDRLIALGKSFDYMAYPNRDHGLREGEGTRFHLRMLMARYLLTNLPPGPR